MNRAKAQLVVVAVSVVLFLVMLPVNSGREGPWNPMWLLQMAIGLTGLIALIWAIFKLMQGREPTAQ